MTLTSAPLSIKSTFPSNQPELKLHGVWCSLFTSLIHCSHCLSLRTAGETVQLGSTALQIDADVAAKVAQIFQVLNAHTFIARILAISTEVAELSGVQLRQVIEECAGKLHDTTT